MRKTLRCPKCEGEKILAVDAITDKSQLEKGAVLAIDADRPWTIFGSWKNTGQFSCCVCAACGYAEWYVRDAANLPVDGERIRVLSEPEERPPYR